MEILGGLFSVEFMYTVIRLTTPILFATLSAVISSKCGVVNIATEGMMLIAALVAVVASASTQSVTVGVVAAMGIGAIIGLIFILVIIKLKTNPVLTGIAFNTIATGSTVFALWMITGDKGASTSLKSMKVPQIEIPIIKNIPIIGEIFSGHSALTYIALLCVLLMSILLFRTSIGLRIRAVGENEKSAKTAGINVEYIKILALMISGALSGLGGAFMSMSYLSWFSTNMTAGRGFIGLAAEAMGKGTPLGGFIVSVFFGFTDAVANVLQTLITLPGELIQMIPYVSTIVGLALVSWIAKKRRLKKEMGEVNE